MRSPEVIANSLPIISWNDLKWKLAGLIWHVLLSRKRHSLFVFASYVTCEENQTTKDIGWRFCISYLSKMQLDFLCSRSFWFSIARWERSFYTVQCWRANGVCTRLQRKLLVSKVLPGQTFFVNRICQDYWFVILMRRLGWQRKDKSIKHSNSKQTIEFVPSIATSSIENLTPTWSSVHTCPWSFNDGDPQRQHFPAIEVPNAVVLKNHSDSRCFLYDMGSLPKMESQWIIGKVVKPK